MFKNRFIKVLIAASIIILAIIGCQKKQAEKNKLYIGTNAEFEPFEYREGDKIVGFDVDLITEISKLIGVKIEFVDMKFDGLLPALESKKIDIIIAGMTATDERRKFVNFSDPYYNSKQAMLVYSNNQDITYFTNLSGKKVGVVLGYTGDLLVSELPNVDIQKFNATSETVIALKAQKVDAVILDYEPAKNYAAQNPELKLVETDSATEEYAIAMRKDDNELLAKVNEALQTLKDNGTYDALLEKYF